MPGVLAQPDDIDQLILWRMGDPRYRTVNQYNLGKKGSRNMAQRQWTIEARADFADAEKNAVIDEAVRVAAVHIHAQLALLMDNGVSPQVICRSDDWFTGEKQIALHPDTLGQAIASQDVGATAPVSEDMLSALRDRSHPDVKAEYGNGIYSRADLEGLSDV